MQNVKDEVLTILIDSEKDESKRSTGKLRDFLNNSDYFSAPCSTHYHLSCEGGLAQHSLNVYKLLCEKNRYLKLGLSSSTLAITALCHDLCKVGYYVIDDEVISQPQQAFLSKLTDGKDGDISKLTKGFASKLIDWYLKKQKNLVVGDKPVFGNIYRVQDTFPFGHGEKSAYILLRFFDATPIEILMIRHHMGQYNFSGKDAGNIYTADYEASNITESATFKPIEVPQPKEEPKKDWVMSALQEVLPETPVFSSDGKLLRQ